MSYSVKMDGVDLQCKGMECDTRKARAARLMIMCVSKAAAFNQKRPFFKKNQSLSGAFSIATCVSLMAYLNKNSCVCVCVVLSVSV